MVALFSVQIDERELREIRRQINRKPSKPQSTPVATLSVTPLAVPKKASPRMEPRTYHIVRSTEVSEIPSVVVEPEAPKPRYKQAFEAASTKKKLEELQGWFEDYGRDGILKSRYNSRDDLSKSA
jgi:hypothetical protein